MVGYRSKERYSQHFSAFIWWSVSTSQSAFTIQVTGALLKGTTKRGVTQRFTREEFGPATVDEVFRDSWMAADGSGEERGGGGTSVRSPRPGWPRQPQGGMWQRGTRSLGLGHGDGGGSGRGGEWLGQGEGVGVVTVG